MIILNLKGGLGNQMFQYALGRKLSLQNNDKLKLDTSGLSRANEVGDIYRPYLLNSFNIKASIASPEEVLRLKYPYGILSKAIRRFRFKILRQFHIGYEPEILKQSGDIYLDGFWQSPKYFEDIREDLLKDFSLKNPLSSSATKFTEQIKGNNAVSIHVRRGDYVSKKLSSSYGLCSVNYYNSSIEEIKKRSPGAVFFIFSDDLAWVKSKLPLPENSIFVEGEVISSVEEITLMSLCKHNIIANSSFGWWAAWLNRNPNKIVVAPRPWFNKRNSQDQDLIPSAWIRMKKN